MRYVSVTTIGLYFLAMLVSSDFFDSAGSPGSAPSSSYTGSSGSTGSGSSGSDAEPVASNRCEVVPGEIAYNLEQGLTVTGGGTLRSVQAVRSNDYRRVWFVSGDLEGSGLEGEQIATWATNSLDPSQPAGFASVNSFALEFSNWTNGPDTDAQLSMDDDGAEESQECASASGP